MGVEHPLGGVVAVRGGATSWLMSGTQFKSRREEEERDVVAGGPFHTITWAGASQYRAFGRTQGRPVPYRCRRGCTRWSSLVTTSGTQLKSCREEEGRGVVADGPFHTTTWAGASQYHAFGRTQGRPVPYCRWRRGCARWSSLVATSPTQLQSSPEEEGRGVVAERLSRLITWVGAPRYHALWRTHGGRAPYRWRRGRSIHLRGPCGSKPNHEGRPVGRTARSGLGYPGNWVRRPFRHKTTPLLLTTRLQLRWRRLHERVPRRAATTPHISHSASPLTIAPKGVISICTDPGNWVGPPFRHKKDSAMDHAPSPHDTTVTAPTGYRPRARAPPRTTATTPPIWH